MNRILLETSEVDPGGGVRLSGPRAEHIRTVLRAGPGCVVRIGIVDGPAGEGRVRDISPAGVELACSFVSGRPRPEPLDLLLALPRPKVLRRLIPQVAAIGVRHIFLTNAWRVEKSYFATHRLDAGRLREGLIEGLQQAGATRLPGVSVHRHLRPLVEDDLDRVLPGGTARLVAAPRASVRLGGWVPGRGEDRALVAVGPEGGWIPAEEDLFRRHGFCLAGLGDRVLRSDTACIALLSVLRARLESDAR